MIVAAGGGKVSLDLSGDDARKPSFVVAREGETGGVRFAGLPIDRIFAKGDVVVHAVNRLEAVGSDHLPVLAELERVSVGDG